MNDSSACISGLFLITAMGSLMAAQTEPPPTTYSATIVRWSRGVPRTTEIYRDGSKAVVETRQFNPLPRSRSVQSHSRAFYDLESGSVLTTDLNQGPSNPAGQTPISSPNCRASTFTGAWGDPFERSAQLLESFQQQDLRETGVEKLKAFTTRVYESPVGWGKTKVWVETSYGMIVRVEVDGNPQMEVKRLDVARPPESCLVPSAYCAYAKL